MREEGVVIEAHPLGCGIGDRVKVRLPANSACVSCRACSAASGGDAILDAVNAAHVNVGDRVVLEISESRQVKAAALIYLLPLASFFAAYALGRAVSFSDAASVAAGLALMALCFAVLHRYDARMRRSGDLLPRVIGVVGSIGEDINGGYDDQEK